MGPQIVFNILIAFLWIASWIIASAWYRRANGKPIFPRVPADAVFYEHWCSGRSLRNWLTRIGGARNCLIVYIRANELTVTPKFPFTLMFLPEIYGMDVSTPLALIAFVEPTRGPLGHALRIVFAKGGPLPMELRLHGEDDFIRCLGNDLAVSGNAIRSTPQKPRKNRRMIALRGFLAVWGAFALVAAFSGLLDDFRFRRNGIDTTGVFEGHSGTVGDRYDMGILTYFVDGERYSLTSFRGPGLYKIGEEERIYYLRSKPEDAREAYYLIFDLIWLGLGALTLVLSAFMGRIMRRLGLISRY